MSFSLLLLIEAEAWAQPIRVVVYGDSLTSGYQLPAESGFPGKLDRKLKALGYDNVEVINMSQPGETTAGGVEKLNSLVLKRPDIVILELGSNDAIRGIAVNMVYGNLATIIGKLRESNVYTVLVGAKAPSSLGYSYSSQLESGYERLAEFYKLPFYPFVLEGILGEPELNLADGYHPNSKGVDVMVEGIYRLVDAGVRWKLEVQRYNQEYNQELQRANSASGTPSRGNSEPPPVPVNPALMPPAPTPAN